MAIKKNLKIFGIPKWNWLLPLIFLTMGCQTFSSADKKFSESFIEINQKKLYFQSQGTDYPAVVFESGMGGWSIDWLKVQGEVSKFAKTISYDRFGYGQSDEALTPRTIENIADELHQLIEKLDVQKKYILVGHSLGGLYIQYYARKYPDQIAGVILVDSVSYHQSRLMPHDMRAKYEGNLLKSTAFASKLAPFGLLRLFNKPSSLILDKIPEEHRSLARGLAFQSKAYHTLAQEMRHFQSNQLAVENAGVWPSIPITLISSQKLQDFPPGFQGEEMKKFWDQMQNNLSQELNAKVVNAKSSGHFIHLDEPSLVTEAILQIVRNIK